MCLPLPWTTLTSKSASVRPACHALVVKSGIWGILARVAALVIVAVAPRAVTLVRPASGGHRHRPQGLRGGGRLDGGINFGSAGATSPLNRPDEARPEREVRQEQGHSAEGDLGPLAQAAVRRAALRRALVAHGLLRFSSAQVAEPF